jgi:hypothetical protein
LAAFIEKQHTAPRSRAFEFFIIENSSRVIVKMVGLL